MKKIIRILEILILKFLGIINKVIPKSSLKVLFFTNLVRFNDNNRALFEYLIENDYSERYKIFYATPDYLELKQIFSSQKNVEYISIYRAVLLFLTTKYVFYDGGTLKIAPSNMQYVVSMWHGTPLKKIGREKHGLNFERYDDFSFIITTSNIFTKVFMEAFECSEQNVKIMGYPRNDNLFLSKTDSIFDNLGINPAKKNVIWMPTFRNSQDGKYKNSSKEITSFELPLFENMEDLLALDKLCKKNDLALIIKIHPLSALNNYISNIPKFSNIFIVTSNMLYANKIQNYKLLSQCDALITDYSSVYFDYLLLNRPIYFVLDDLEDYQKLRGFTFDNPLEYMCGEIITDKEQFYCALNNFISNKDDYQTERLNLLNKIHSATKTNNASRNLLNSIGLCLDKEIL